MVIRLPQFYTQKLMWTLIRYLLKKKLDIEKFYSGYYVTCSLMAKTKDFIYCNGFDDKFRRCEDTEFAIRSSLKDSHFIGVNKTLVFQNMSYKKYKTHSIELDYILKIFEKHINLFKSKKEYKFEIFWNILKYKILEKNFLNATIIFLKLFRMDLIHLVKKLFLISNTLKQNLFIFKNYDDNLRWRIPIIKDYSIIL